MSKNILIKVAVPIPTAYYRYNNYSVKQCNFIQIWCTYAPIKYEGNCLW